MDASTRLYKRLGEIPEDPEDPDSLDNLLVCAFGAFERYYVCWKTRAGEYKQDGYDLPPVLRDWLYPTDGTTRDFASLQVVFGRGEEFFASDRHGKLEYKEPEVKKLVEDEEKIDRQALRRSRAVSFLRPLSETSVRSDSSTTDSSRSKRSSSTSSQRASRPPSLSYSRTNSELSILDQPMREGQRSQPTRKATQSSLITMPSQARPNYANATTQTSPPPSPLPIALRIDTSASSYWPSTHSYSAVSEDDEIPPVFMGRMMNYFSKPGYQLGDSLFSGYQLMGWQNTFEYQDEFREEALW